MAAGEGGTSPAWLWEDREQTQIRRLCDASRWARRPPCFPPVPTKGCVSPWLGGCHGFLSKAMSRLPEPRGAARQGWGRAPSAELSSPSSQSLWLQTGSRRGAEVRLLWPPVPECPVPALPALSGRRVCLAVNPGPRTPHGSPDRRCVSTPGGHQLDALFFRGPMRTGYPKVSCFLFCNRVFHESLTPPAHPQTLQKEPPACVLWPLVCPGISMDFRNVPGRAWGLGEGMNLLERRASHRALRRTQGGNCPFALSGTWGSRCHLRTRRTSAPRGPGPWEPLPRGLWGHLGLQVCHSGSPNISIVIWRMGTVTTSWTW